MKASVHQPGPVVRPPCRALLPIFLLYATFFLSIVHAETKLDFWHSYTHQPSGLLHYSFHVASYKRGLFFGSCGPSTRSLQWQYEIDLAGPGPVYQKDQVTITSDGKAVEVVAGQVTISSNKKEAAIKLRINVGDEVKDFVANGSHRIQKLK